LTRRLSASGSCSSMMLSSETRTGGKVASVTSLQIPGNLSLRDEANPSATPLFAPQTTNSDRRRPQLDDRGMELVRDVSSQRSEDLVRIVWWNPALAPFKNRHAGSGWPSITYSSRKLLRRTFILWENMANIAIAVHYCYSAQSIRMGRPSRSLPLRVAAFPQASVFQNSTKPLKSHKIEGTKLQTSSESSRIT
jgi:hypothetical protein